MKEVIILDPLRIKRVRSKVIARESSNAFTGGLASTTIAMMVGLMNPEVIGMISSMGRVFPLFDGLAIMIPARTSEKVGITFHIISIMWMFLGDADPRVFGLISAILSGINSLTRLSYDEFVRDLLVRNSTPKESKKHKAVRNSTKALCALVGIGLSVILAGKLDWKNAFYVIGCVEIIHLAIKLQLNIELRDVEVHNG